MDAEILKRGSVDPVEESTAALVSVTNTKNDNEDHEPCELYSGEWVGLHFETNITKLRLGVAAACQACSIVLDAITTYNSGRLSVDIIAKVQVIRYSDQIEVYYRKDQSGKERQYNEQPHRVELQLFRLEGQELHTPPLSSLTTLSILTRRIPSEDTSSDRALQSLHNWTETCVRHHKACAGRKVNRLPKRVLEIDGEHVYLRERLRVAAMYACLSHCWGPSGPALRLDKTTSSRFADGILIDQLPKTFADAVHLCARLGLRFIWIDACCVMQDDNDDWKEAAATMAAIYEQAHLTIAATWGSNSDCGLFAPDQERYKARKLKDHGLYVREFRASFPVLNRPYTPEFPLLGRAWVYQERVLSSRMVHFCKDQMYWQCPTQFIPESGMTYPSRYNLFEVIEDPVDRWHKVVSEYSGLELTYASDRLPAVAAIVEREMRLRQDDIYIAGMWKNSLLPDLAWVSRSGKLQAWCPQIRSPSWAWPSSQAQIDWLSGPLERSLRLMDLSYAHVGPANVGKVSTATITLEGHIYMVRLKEPFELNAFLAEDYMEIFPRSLSDVRLDDWNSCPDFDWTTGDRPVAVGDTFVVLLINLSSDWGQPSYIGLILREVTDGVFERMGSTGVEAACPWETATLQKTQIVRDFVEALPTRQVKII